MLAPPTEQERLAQLHQLAILDTPKEQGFDDLTRLAQMLCQTPYAFMSFIDAERQWFKASIGLQVHEYPRATSLCNHTLASPTGLLAINNPQQDPRGRHSPLLQQHPDIHFYAATTLRLASGHAIGSLGVFAQEPRQLSETQRQGLQLLAQQTCQRLEAPDRHLVTNSRYWQALEQECLNLKRVVQGAQLGTWQWDLATNLFIVNERWCSMLGYALAELGPITTREWEQLLHPEDAASIYTALEQHLNGSQPYYEQRFRMRHKQGHWVWILARGQRLAEASNQLFGTHAEITELIQSQQKLQASETRLEGMIRNFPGAVYRGSYPGERRMHYLSPAIEKLTGHSAAHLTGDNGHFAGLIHPDDRERVDQHISAALSTCDTFDVLYRIQRSDGQWRYLQEVGTGIYDAQRQLQYLDGFMWDATERQRSEQLKNDFIAVVSHELRTPLTVIHGALGLILHGPLGELPDKTRQMLHIAHKNSLRLGELINDLLDMEKLAAGKQALNLQLQPLLPQLEQALSACDSYAQACEVALLLAVDNNAGVQLPIDSGRLQQALAHLLNNAIKFSPRRSQVQLGLTRQGKQVCISVRDQGPGIAAEFHGRIFQAFAQADSSSSRQQGGTGLGLAISKALVEGMGGSLGFSSPAGEGATFVITFTLATADLELEAT